MMRSKALCSSSLVVFMLSAAAEAQSVDPSAPIPAAAASEQAVQTSPADVAPTDPAPVDGSDIVVTAQRRSQTLQNTALSITALTADDLAKSPVYSLADVQTLVPSVNITPRLSAGVVTIRGIGFDIVTAGAEGSVAIHSDGVYQSRPAGALSSLFDLERIEVARGPQGTLYGRNATGGVINIITKKPSRDFDGFVDFSYGNYNALSMSGAVGGPIVPDLLHVRVSAKFDDRNGYGVNTFNDRDIDDLNSRALRAQLEFLPTPDLSFLFITDYVKQSDSSGARHYSGCVRVPCGPNAGTSLGFPVPRNLRDGTQDVQPFNRQETRSVSLTTRLDLGAAKFTSISAFRTGDGYYIADLDGTGRPGLFITREEDYDAFSQELQLGGTAGRLDWLVGAFYFYENNLAQANGQFTAPLSRFFQGGRLKTEAYAVFGEGTFRLTDQFALTLGARYSDESKRIRNERTFSNGPANQASRAAAPTLGDSCVSCRNLPSDVSFDSFTPKIGLEFKPADRHLLYATAQRGFKSGSFAVGAVTPAFQPETIWSYEAGYKGRWFDGSLTTNLSVFHYDYSDLQLGFASVASTVVTNAGEAKVDGVEFELRADLGSRLTFDGNVSYIDARFVRFMSANPAISLATILDLKGNLLSNSPRWSGRAGVQYRAPLASGELLLRGDVFASSRVYFSPFNNPSNSQSAYSLQNASVTWNAADERWSVGAYVNNISNKLVKAGGTPATILVGGFVNNELYPPRTYGVRVGTKF